MCQLLGDNMKQLTGAEFKQLVYENNISLRSIAQYSKFSETFIYAWTAGTYKFDIKPKTYTKIIEAYQHFKKSK